MLLPITPLTDFNMKMSELIKILEDYKKSYGDCQIFCDAGYNTVHFKMDVKDDDVAFTAVSYKM